MKNILNFVKISVWGINLTEHIQQVLLGPIRWEEVKIKAKKVSGEEDTSSRCILGQFQTAIKCDQKWISK